MQEQLYRQQSLEHITSPDELHDFLCVTNPRLWMILSTIVVLLVGFLVYASTATLENTVPVKLTLETIDLGDDGDSQMRTVVYGDVPLTYENLLKPGMSIRLGGEKGIIKSVFELEDGIVNIICEMENQYIPLPDGEYEAEVVVEATTPISFLWQ